MSGFLDMISEPAHVKKLTEDQLEQLATELREELITKLAKTGGHLGPNLGVVELTIAMHKVFSTPHDKFVWDVSHQSYVHKLLTGRREGFAKIRQTGGLNGFALRSESEHDSFGAGHAGTALSAALGMCAARDQKKTDEDVVCVFGDAALTNGISYEALNNIAQTTEKFIGILNDNEWSIDKNVGAISKYLNKIITNPGYNRLHDDLSRLVKKLPKGDFAVRLGNRAEGALKAEVSESSLKHQPPASQDGRGGTASSVIFEELGIRYIGPLDGHNLPLMIKSLEYAKSCDHPVVLHVLTKKGKGYNAALKQPEKFHGLGPYDAKTGHTPSAKSGSAPNWQDVFGQQMLRICERDSRVVGVGAAMPSGTGLKYLRDEMPGRYFDVGIAEEHAVIFAAGMATMECHPVVAIYSTFLQRAYDCIIHDVALQDLPVTFCMDRAGLSANDGPTHHGLFDISYLRCVPNIVAMAPRNEDELADMMFTATRHKHPTFIRYPRGAAEGTEIKDEPEMLEIGKAEVVQNFKDSGKRKIAFFGLGPMFTIAQKAAEELGEDFDCALINPRFTKPIDEATTEYFAKTADQIVTLEDHVLPGGYGSVVSELLVEKGISTPLLRIGWPDQFIEHASSVNELREKYGLTSKAIIAQIKATPAAKANSKVTAAA
ncbi:MAG: 1-deoxy-D-xylulose-5-phosphate synthase [Verrucomicrobia subdivision 3 bacterium]|nr:1-deoxy-D-xylulose-5-phosphate synthase [Limisphaerales bacterium]